MPKLEIVDGQPSEATLQSFSKNCKGDACVGDTVLFERAVYVGEYRDSYLSHYEKIIASITKDSYGKLKQQHTFTLDVHWSSDGHTGRLTIKGRNLYKRGTMRQKWADEQARKEILNEKHQRGGKARTARTFRKGSSR